MMRSPLNSIGLTFAGSVFKKSSGKYDNFSSTVRSKVFHYLVHHNLIQPLFFLKPRRLLINDLKKTICF